MKITPFDELYPNTTATYGTILGSASGSNGAFGGDVVGEPGGASVIGLGSTVSLGSNLGAGNVIGDVLTLIQTSPRLAIFATPSNSSTGSNALLRTTGGAGGVTTITTAGAATTLMVGGANTFDVTLTAASCAISLTGAAASGSESSVLVILRQDGSGNRLVTWPGSVTWSGGSAPTLSTTAGAIDFVLLETVDGGTNWFGFPVGGSSGTASPLTTKGDLYTYSTTNTRLAVGSNGMFPVADDGEAVGFRWTTNPAVGELLTKSTPAIPITFDDLLTNSLGDDLVYGSR